MRTGKSWDKDAAITAVKKKKKKTTDKTTPDWMYFNRWLKTWKTFGETQRMGREDNREIQAKICQQGKELEQLQLEQEFLKRRAESDR